MTNIEQQLFNRIEILKKYLEINKGSNRIDDETLWQVRDELEMIEDELEEL